MLPTSLLFFILPALTGAVEIVSHARRTQNGLHLPVYKREATSSEHGRRAGDSVSAIGLGNFRDITYLVNIQMGENAMPLVLDTGSSDLWAISDACTDPVCKNGLPLYPQETFKPAGIDARLFYGDSLTGTHAFGEVGKDVVSLAGLTIQDQLFASINQTNTTVPATQGSGIFGLGFPVNSVIWNQAFRAQFPRDGSPVAKRSESNLRMSAFPDLKGILGGARKRMMNAMRELPYVPNYRSTAFPDLGSLLPSGTSPSKRQTTATNPTLNDLLSTFESNGPLMSRLAQSELASPEFTVTLQRDTIEVGGNVGMLSLGELPEGVSNGSLTWVGVRGYTADQGGINSPTDVYPIAWEVPIDDVFLDGKRLPRSTLSPGIAVTALVDTGNSLIRGPADVVQALFTEVTGSSSALAYDCSVPHTMSFQIGGKMFPVDPRDFMRPQLGANGLCQPNVVATDPPKDGFLYSWSLGDPFLKSVLASFYFGNITHPSVDPPRMGFMSTVPADATQQQQAVVTSVNANNNGVYPTRIVSAPATNPTALRKVASSSNVADANGADAINGVASQGAGEVSGTTGVTVPGAGSTQTPTNANTKSAAVGLKSSGTMGFLGALAVGLTLVGGL